MCVCRHNFCYLSRSWCVIHDRPLLSSACHETSARPCVIHDPHFESWVWFFYEFVFQNVVISQSNWWPHIYTCKLTICMIQFHDLQVQPCDNWARVALSGTSLWKQNWAIYTDRCWLSTDLSISFTQDRSPTIYLDICTEDYRRVDTIRYADVWTIWNLLPQIIYR